MSDIRSKLAIKTLERHWHRSGAFILNFEHVSHIQHVVFLFLTLNM